MLATSTADGPCSKKFGRRLVTQVTETHVLDAGLIARPQHCFVDCLFVAVAPKRFAQDRGFYVNVRGKQNRTRLLTSPFSFAFLPERRLLSRALRDRRLLSTRVPRVGCWLLGAGQRLCFLSRR